MLPYFLSKTLSSFNKMTGKIVKILLISMISKSIYLNTTAFNLLMPDMEFKYF